MADGLVTADELDTLDPSTAARRAWERWKAHHPRWPEVPPGFDQD